MLSTNSNYSGLAALFIGLMLETVHMLIFNFTAYPFLLFREYLELGKQQQNFTTRKLV